MATSRPILLPLLWALDVGDSSQVTRGHVVQLLVETAAGVQENEIKITALGGESSSQKIQPCGVIMEAWACSFHLSGEGVSLRR